MAPADDRGGALMFRCPRSGTPFDSGFLADQESLAAVPQSAKMRLRCKECSDIHEVRVAEGFVQSTVARPARRDDMLAVRTLHRSR
jgi:hypothetical protein